MKSARIITIFGANGFIGQETVRVLAKQGYILRLPCRHPKKAELLKFNGQVGQIVPMTCDFTEADLRKVINGAFCVINATGILNEKGKRTFTATHHDLPLAIAQACKKENVEQFVHISALGVTKAKSRYAQSKMAGDKAIQRAFDNVTILRPSLVFGAKDSFFNKFAAMADILPFLPLIGGGKTLFQPVYVGDVADAVSIAIKKRRFGVFELAGPVQYSFKDLMTKMLAVTKQKTRLVYLPFWLANIMAVFMSILPNPPLTRDQIKSLKTDNVQSNNAMTLSDLGITPTHMDSTLPTYLERYQ